MCSVSHKLGKDMQQWLHHMLDGLPLTGNLDAHNLCLKHNHRGAALTGAEVGLLREASIGNSL